MCLFCGNNIDFDVFYFEFPCKCRLCSETCFNKFMETFHKRIKVKKTCYDFKPEILNRCGCDAKIDINYIFNMIDKIDVKCINYYIDDLYDYIKINWLWKCMCCKENFILGRKNYRITFRNDKISERLKDKINYEHFICGECLKFFMSYLKQDPNSIMECEFCNAQHQVDKIYKVNDDNNKGELKYMIN